MGKFVYANDTSANFEDRLLLHLQLVIGMKLRRGESFTFSWKPDTSTAGGRVTVWLYPQASIVFRYSGSRRSRVNSRWLEALMFTANQPTGLHIVPEPTEENPPELTGAAGDGLIPDE
jgi:hypothetical protein